MKRFCQTLELTDDPLMIEKYRRVHADVWPEIIAGQRAVGILDMQIWIKDTHAFMICDTVDSFDWERDWARLAGMPRQAEWEAFVSICQGAEQSLPSAEKWHLMDKIFDMNANKESCDGEIQR